MACLWIFLNCFLIWWLNINYSLDFAAGISFSGKGVSSPKNEQSLPRTSESKEKLSSLKANNRTPSINMSSIIHGRILNTASEWNPQEKWPETGPVGTLKPEESFCVDRYVRGNCRDRDNPFECDRWEWTAYATIQNTAGVDRIRSVPEGLYLTPLPPIFVNGVYEYRQVRVSLTVTCCTPVVQFVSETFGSADYGKTCIVNVNELQGLKAYEYVLIIGSSLILFVVILIGMWYFWKRYKTNQEMKSSPRFRR